MSQWIVLKFGGTSVSTAARWECICEQISSRIEKEDAFVWVTISALTQVTNKLQRAIESASTGNGSHMEIIENVLLQHFELSYEVGLFPAISDSGMTQYDIWKCKWLDSVLKHEENSPFVQVSIDADIPESLFPLLKEFGDLIRLLEGIKLTQEASPKIQARVMAFGEILSTHLGVCIMHHNGLLDVERVDARSLLISNPSSSKSEEDKYLQAEVLPSVNIENATEKSLGKRVVLTQGFIASTADGATCVLGRGGSDTSGSLFAALLNASRYEIWTDVHGMFTTDPRSLADARLIKCLDYREAQELAAMGAKVLHPRCLNPVEWAKIPLEIRNTNDPNGEKTIIRPSMEEDSGSSKILAVVKRQNMTSLSISSFDMCGASGFLAKVFLPFEKLGISVDLIATSQFSVTVTLDHIPGGLEGKPFEDLLQELRNGHSKVEVFESCSVVSIVGRRLRRCLGELGKLFDQLEGYDVLLLSESAEDLNLSFVLEQSNSDPVVKEMHRRLFPSDNQGDNGDIITQTEGNRLKRSPSRDSLLGPTWGTLMNQG